MRSNIFAPFFVFCVILAVVACGQKKPTLIVGQPDRSSHQHPVPYRTKLTVRLDMKATQNATGNAIRFIVVHRIIDLTSPAQHVKLPIKIIFDMDMNGVSSEMDWEISKYEHSKGVTDKFDETNVPAIEKDAISETLDFDLRIECDDDRIAQELLKSVLKFVKIKADSSKIPVHIKINAKANKRDFAFEAEIKPGQKKDGRPSPTLFLNMP